MKYALQQRTIDGKPIDNIGVYARSMKPYIEITMIDENERYIYGDILSVGIYRGTEKIRSVSANEQELCEKLLGIDFNKFIKTLSK